MLLVKRLASKLGSFFPIIVFIAIEVLLFKANYRPGTWLIGWDSTQPELNLKLNLFRILNSVWQEYRGLGLLDGMAHGANLIHWGYIYLLHLLLPGNLIRYVFVFSMHTLGGVGMFFFLRRVFKTSTTVSILSAIFYLLNPATVQMFYTPLELFLIHFASLPWLFLVLINYLNAPSRKRLVLLFLVNLLSISQFQVPSLFLVYLFGVFVICFFYLKNWKRGLISGLIIFLANAFWLLPYTYSTFQNTQTIVNAKINRLSNPEVILMNRSFGDFKSVVLLQSFNLDYGDWTKDGDYDYQMPVWRELWHRPNIELLGYTLFSLAILGILTGLLRSQKQKLYFPFAIILLFVFSNLATNTPVFSAIGTFLAEKIPFYKEIFRFAFTKFAFFYVFCLSIFIGAFLEIFSGKITKWFRLVVVLALIVMILVLSWPAFRGEFLYNRLKLSVPNEYFETFRFFDAQKEDGRVVILPQPSFWGWEYDLWGYRGSGFIWQGVSKPMLHRSFDPWSAGNETYFNELSAAIEEKDVKRFNQVLTKYGVRWIIFDEYLYQPGGWEKDFFVKELLGLINNNSNILPVKVFGKITIYGINLNQNGQYVFSLNDYVLINTDLTYSPIDPVYARYGNYVQSAEGLGLPFVNFDPRGPVETSLSQSLNELIFENKTTKSKVILPVKDNITESFAPDRGFTEPYNCDLKKAGRVEKKQLSLGREYAAYDGGIACDYFTYHQIKNNQAYILRIKGQNWAGRSLKIYLFNEDTKRTEIEELLPEGVFDEYYVVYPKTSGNNSGYTLNVETRSFGKIFSRNTIEAIEIIPFDIDYVTNLYIDAEKNIYQTSDLEVFQVKKFGTAFYRAEVKGEGLLFLSQGYEDGWIALAYRPNSQFSILNFQLLKHFRVNSWANGWDVQCQMLNVKCQIFIFFWPQLLEFVGMLTALICFVIVAKKRS